MAICQIRNGIDQFNKHYLFEIIIIDVLPRLWERNEVKSLSIPILSVTFERFSVNRQNGRCGLNKNKIECLRVIIPTVTSAFSL